MKACAALPKPIAYAEAPAQVELLDLPDGALEIVFRQLDELSRGKAAGACKRFAALVPEARRAAPLPTRQELWDMGCPNPDAKKILAAFARRESRQEPNDLRRHYEKGAALQKAVRRGTAASFFVEGNRYSGAAKDGVPINFGWHEYANGRFEGEFEDGKRHGRGFYVWANGNRYEGGAKEGKWHGRGVYVWADGSRYEGEYKDHKRHGRGTQAWASGHRYEGEYKDDVPHGQGLFIRADGERFKGACKNGKRDGWGVSIKADGERYEGEYKDGKRHGRGALTRADGSRFVGQFRDGVPLGEQPPRRGKIRSRLLECFSGA